jgi:membrane protein
MTASPIALFKMAVAKWSADNAARLSAALAYYAVFSVAPLLIIAIAVAGLVFGRDAAQGEIFRQLDGLIGAQGAAVVQEMVKNASKPGSGIIAGLIGFVMLLFGASGVTGELKSALNGIWEVPPPPAGGMFYTMRERLLSLTLVLGVGFILMVSLVVSAGVAAMGQYFQAWLPGSESMLHAVNFGASLLVITLMFMVIFRFVPDAKLEWGDVWMGAVVTAFLFSIGKLLIGLYLGKGTLGSTYGAAGSLVIFLAWVYYSAQILFFGAEFTHVYAREHGSRIVAARASERSAGVGEKRTPNDRRTSNRRRRYQPASVH